MSNPRDPREWHDGNAASFRAFINSNPYFFRELRRQIAKCTGTTVEERAVSGSEQQGALNLIEHMEEVMMVDLPRGIKEAGFLPSESHDDSPTV